MPNTPKLDMPEISESQASKYLTHNEALRILDATVQCVAISNVVTVPPGSPSDGDMYIVGAGATGTWSGHDDELAYYRSSSWVFITPQEGWHCWVLSSGAWFMYQSASTGWVLALEAFYFDIGGGCNGAPAASQVLLRAIMVRSISFDNDFAGSQAEAEVAATAQTDFDVQKNGSSIGYFRFAAAGTAATFVTSGSGDETFSAGDVLKVVAPASPDATLANIAFTFAGTKV